MGNTPSQQPFESDPQEGTEVPPDASLPARVVRSVRSFFTAIRRRLRGASKAGTGSGDEPSETAPQLVTDESTPAPPATPDTPADGEIADLPARETPFTQPADDCGDGNGPELQATESDGRLAIYYPNCPGASIESDTWERVER